MAKENRKKKHELKCFKIKGISIMEEAIKIIEGFNKEDIIEEDCTVSFGKIKVLVGPETVLLMGNNKAIEAFNTCSKITLTLMDN